MVDDFMVCVDRIIATAACYNRPAEAQTQAQSDGALVVAEQERRSDHHHHHCLLHHHHNRNESSVVNVSNCENGDDEGCSSASAEAAATALMSKKKVGDNKMVVAECRICQEEDDVLNMEAPCACNGTLKFAHRKCIQRWCNKKGDITCEICNQIFSPNYSLPPARSNPDVMAIDIRQPWGPHIDLRESHLLALAAAERQFLQSEYEDYAAANTSSIACLRSVALILLMVWLMRQVLMATRDSGMVQESSTFFNFQVSLLQFAGFFLPCYVMARSWYVMQSRRRRQGLFGQH